MKTISGYFLTFTQTAAPTGGTGTYTYLWQQQPGCTGGWSDISGATASTYNHTGNLTQNTCFRRIEISACDTAYSNVADSRLAGFWKFNGDFNDYSGHNINGTGTNTSWTSDRFNNSNSALVFDGSAYVSLNNPQNLLADLSKFTISAWIKTTANSYQGRIVTLHYGSSGGSSISIMERSGKFDFYLRGENSYYSTGVSINNNQWHLVVLSYDGSTYKAFVDGSLVYSVASANYSTLGSYNRNIGTFDGSSTYNFNGNIDEVQIYNISLTADEITSLYNATNNKIRVTVYPELTAGSVGSSQSICYNTSPAVFTQTGAPTGGTGSYTYQWQNTTVSGCASGWAAITGATAMTYQAPAITATTCYRRNITSGSCGTVSSSAITITVNPLPNAEAGINDTIILGDSLQIGSSPVGGNTYLWSPATGLSSTSVANPWAKPITSRYYYVAVTNSYSCTNKDSVFITTLGTSCLNAIQLTPDTLLNIQEFNMADTVMWFKFVADSANIRVFVENLPDSLGTFKSLFIYSGSCNNLNLIVSENNMYQLFIHDVLLDAYNLLLGETYYLNPFCSYQVINA